MKILKKQNLTTYYIAIQTIGIYFAIQTTLLINSNFPIRNALILHLLSIVFFIIGSKLPALNIKHKEIETTSYITISSNFYFYCIVLVTAGLVVSLSQISSLMSINEYFSLLLKNDSSLNEIRSASASGGLSGVLKMFAFAPLSIYLLCEGILKFFSTDDNNTKKLKN